MFILEDMLCVRKMVMRNAVSRLYRAVSPFRAEKTSGSRGTRLAALEKKRYHQRFVEYQRSLERATSQYSRPRIS